VGVRTLGCRDVPGRGGRGTTAEVKCFIFAPTERRVGRQDKRQDKVQGQELMQVQQRARRRCSDRYPDSRAQPNSCCWASGLTWRGRCRSQDYRRSARWSIDTVTSLEIPRVLLAMAPGDCRWERCCATGERRSVLKARYQCAEGK